MDPFYSVDIQTGEFRDFSIITDGDISEINNLFLNDPIYKLKKKVIIRRLLIDI